jgi:hypothetical protein
MRIQFTAAALAAVALFSGTYFGLTATAVAQQPITIRAAAVLDGKGGVERNAVVTVEGSRITKLGDGPAQA